MTVQDNSTDSALPPVPEVELFSYAREAVWPGFATQKEVLEQLEDYWVGSRNHTPPTHSQALSIVQRVWAERSTELGGADGEDSHAALQGAFDQLEAAGIVARMDFTCCQTCGHAEIGLEKEGGDPRGYTFFHHQDTQRICGGSVMLAFGAFPGATRNGVILPAEALLPVLDPNLPAAVSIATDEDSREQAKRQVWVAADEAIAREVVSVVRAHGLAVEWNGSCRQRIKVQLPEWRKPLPV